LKVIADDHSIIGVLDLVFKTDQERQFAGQTHVASLDGDAGSRYELRSQSLQKWHNLLKAYRGITLGMRSKEDLTEAERHAFSDSCHVFSECYLDMFCASDITNYCHYITSNHCFEMLGSHGSLYKYNQQAWEGMNQELKQWYLYQTSRNGGSPHENVSQQILR
jgi:hypothetical protein